MLRTTPFGRALPILPAFPRYSSCSARPRSTRRPTSFRSLHQRGAPFLAPDVPLHSACYGSSRCIRPAYATANQRPASRWSVSRPSANPPHRCQVAQGPQKALTPPVSTPYAARRPPARKCRPPAPKVCVQATQANGIGPLRGGFCWGAPQAPAIMSRLPPGHFPRVPQLKKAAPPSSGRLRRVIVGASPKPLRKAFSGCSGACPGPFPVG